MKTPDSFPWRLGFISSVSGLGGAELYLIDLITHLDRNRFAPYLLAGSQGPLVARLKRQGVPVYFCSFPFFSKRRPWIYLRSIWDIVFLVRRHGIALLHVNCDRSVPHAVLASRIARVPVVCCVHDMLRAWSMPKYVRYLNRVAAVVANSQATAEYCVGAGVKAQKVRVIYPGCDVERFQACDANERQWLRTEWGIEPHEVAIGLVGQVLRYKGHEEFLRAAVSVVREFPTSKFVIVGDDALSCDKGFLPFLRRFADEVELSNRVLFAGFREDIPRVMAALDIIAVPSWTEGFGRVVVEAMAAGRPVVATSVGGIPEIVEEGVTGLLIPPRDPPGLAQGLLRLCKDPQLREQMGRLGQSAAKNFDIKRHVHHFQQTYEAILRAYPKAVSSAS